MVKSHIIKPTTSTAIPRRFIFFDCETKDIQIEPDKRQHYLRLGVGIFCERNDIDELEPQKELVFRNGEQFWLWVDQLCRSKTTTYVIAHNCIFDIVVSHGFNWLYELGWEMTSFYSKGMTTIIRYKDEGRKLNILDNGNFFQGRLARWGKIVGLPKLDIDFATADDEYLLEYCRRDVMIMVRLWETWIRFLRENDCGAFKPTVASTAFNVWRHRFLNHRVYVHRQEEALTLEREAYRGGRTECLWVGKRSGDVYYYVDVNNMYGYVLSNHNFPAGIWRYKSKTGKWDLAQKLERYAVIARVVLNCTDNWFPYKWDNHTIYPVGRFRTVLTTPELQIAMRCGWIESVDELVYYRKAPLFKDFVEYFYKLRLKYKQDSNTGFEKIAKLLVNSLYGKFGQRGFKQKKIGECPIDMIGREEVYDADTGEFYNLIYFAGGVYEERREGESYNSFPAISAHVTAYARIYLKALVNTVPKHHAFYMDTDSLIVDEVGLQALKPYLSETRLGCLKIEYIAADLEIRAPKDYTMGNRERIKGIRSTAEKVTENVYIQEKWPGLRGLLADGIIDAYIIERITKHQRREIWSGVVQSDGWIVPHVLNLDEQPAEKSPQLLHLLQHG